MPKDTFHNLSESKRDRIIEAAVAEFAKHRYEMTSLSRIVSRLGIAKGSMYQYFHNKQDLYLFIVDLVYRTKKDFLRVVFTEDLDFFTRILHYYQRSFLFALEHPLYHQITMNFWESADEGMRQQILASKEMRSSDFAHFLEEAMIQNQVDSHVQKEAAFFVYHSVGKELIDNFHYVSPDQTDDHLRFIEDVLNLLAYGLSARRREYHVQSPS